MFIFLFLNMSVAVHGVEVNKLNILSKCICWSHITANYQMCESYSFSNVPTHCFTYANVCESLGFSLFFNT